MKQSTSSKTRQTFWTKFATVGLIIVTMVISACEVATISDGNTAGSSNALALSASRTLVGQPTPISNQQELADIEAAPNGDYILVNDITVKDWIPICDPSSFSNPFTGTLDGAGHKIIIETFDSSALSGSYLGVFAVIGDNSASPVVVNLTVNVAIPPLVTETARNVGGLAAVVNKADILDVTVTGTLDVTYTGPAPTSAWQIVRTGEIFHARGVGALPIGTDGLAVGGIAGTLAPATVQKAHTSVSINAEATTINVPVYAGGVAGYSNTATITGSESSSNVTSNGFGYNTSGGGIAGYILASEVAASSASGTINVSAFSVEFDWDDSWQVYAGGLVGYSGSSDDTPDTISLVRTSHATGLVTAYAPFPYAGGLVGYNYGYMDPVTFESSNGSAIRQSFATGDVIATTQPDPNNNYGDIPYAGGLVGYSSVKGSEITDSYARGNVTATTPGTYAWAGGLIGGNANNSVVTRTYATGEVRATVGTFDPLYAPLYTNPGPASGGIAGYNYYTNDTVVRNSVALNKLVYGNQTTPQDVVHRVAGDVGIAPNDGLLHNNLAYAGMVVEEDWTQHIGIDDLDGANTAAQPDQTIYEGLNWNFNTIWTMGADGYPAL